MTEEKEFIRTATFHEARKSINLWMSPNSHGWRNCKDIEEAKKMIESTGIPQTLRVQP